MLFQANDERETAEWFSTSTNQPAQKPLYAVGSRKTALTSLKMETEKYQCKEAEEIRAKNNSAREQSSMHFVKLT